jgi:hypothetical protein
MLHTHKLILKITKGSIKLAEVGYRTGVPIAILALTIYNAMQCNAMQCNAMQCNAMQCNAMQCNAIKMKCN